MASISPIFSVKAVDHYSDSYHGCKKVLGLKVLEFLHKKDMRQVLYSLPLLNQSIKSSTKNVSVCAC